jgi:endonuclease G
MKKILFILISLVSITVSAQGRDSVYIKTDIYECVYSEVLEQPKFIRYTVQCPNGTASRAGMDFYVSGDLKTSDAKDYFQNVYDKGHMAPAADFNCTKEMLYKTFSYVNCALQHQELNRVTWRLLEAKERVLAEKYTVTVEIRLVFDKTCTKLPTGATVPKAFYKTIYIKETKQVLKYYFINEKPTSSNPENYLIK